MHKENILNKLKNELVVSCQSSEDNPLYNDDHILLLVESSYRAGVRIFRIDSPNTVRKVRLKYKDIIIIGIYKLEYDNSDVFITPTMQEVDEIISAGADIVAVQATEDISPNGKSAYHIIKEIREKYPDIVIMADISTIEEAKKSRNLGADLISTTLHGYTQQSISYSSCFDFNFLEKLTSIQDCLIVAEGKIWTIEDANRAFEIGADTVVIGTAINNPMLITKHFLEGIINETK